MSSNNTTNFCNSIHPSWIKEEEESETSTEKRNLFNKNKIIKNYTKESEIKEINYKEKDLKINITELFPFINSNNKNCDLEIINYFTKISDNTIDNNNNNNTNNNNIDNYNNNNNFNSQLSDSDIIDFEELEELATTMENDF
ncbi:hypothetical protein ABK040_015885 [Willaertia magna]